VKLAQKALRKRIVGSRKVSVQTAVGWLPSDEQGDGKQVIDVMCTDPSLPFERYGGGGRDNIRLTSCEDAIEFIKEHDGSLPFGFD